MWIFLRKAVSLPFVLKKLAGERLFFERLERKSKPILSCYNKPIMIEAVFLPVGKKLGLNTTGKSF
jgi:hypothetical protein